MTSSLILPILAQIGLTLCVAVTLAIGRLTYIKRHGLETVLKTGLPVKVVNASDNFKNQFEVPVLFYTLCLLIITVGEETSLITGLAWLFVAARICHALVHLTKNVIFPWRFGFFAISLLSVTAMFISFGLQLLPHTS